jgi:hypothetical protein
MVILLKAIENPNILEIHSKIFMEKNDMLSWICIKSSRGKNVTLSKIKYIQIIIEAGGWISGRWPT